MSSPLLLNTAIGATPEVLPIWNGEVRSDRLALDLVKVEPFYTTFRRMIRELEFDLSEMPVVSYAQAYLARIPLTLLPIPVSRRFHHQSILCFENSDIRQATDLVGRRVGVRSWPQTSGVWARGILETEYGIPLERVTWVTQEGAHVESCADPSYVVRSTSGRSLAAMLADGEVDAVMGLQGIPAGMRTVVPDADAAARAWYGATGIFPVNHLVALKSELVETHPWIVEEVTDLFSRSVKHARSAGALAGAAMGLAATQDMHPIGLSPNHASIQKLLDFAAQQQLTPRRVAAEELFIA
ncbi:hypothetical protein [Arvimicrobium flavum]|uniref:hypothetical protein n=1 Tax=Arvimicrobium flavum TaxID=3393320 RepID=UPI00237AFE35|nr:hypothetical protein [Mesorhizobium shangrilense]